MARIGIGIVGGGYMGKAHAVAMSAVGAVFNTNLRPCLEVIAASSPQSAERYAKAFGFRRAARDWQDLVKDPAVQAVVIASPQTTHRAIAEAAAALKKPILCEKPLGATMADGEAMLRAVEAAGVINMVGFNYMRTPASQYACELIADGALGRLYWFRGEHTEDFLADPATQAQWRTQDEATGNMGDLAPHIVNAAMTLIGPIAEVSARIETVIENRPGPGGPEPVRNDDQAQCMFRFESGIMGHLFVSRVATGRKMGYAYEVHGEKGSIRFDQEDQNALWLYQADGLEAARGFRKVLAGPAHPDYLPFCQGPGHGTGYQDQIIIEAAHFLRAIETGEPARPSFKDGLAVHRVLDAMRRSDRQGSWEQVVT